MKGISVKVTKCLDCPFYEYTTHFCKRHMRTFTVSEIKDILVIVPSWCTFPDIY